MAISRKTGEIYYTNAEKEAALRDNNALQYALSRGYNLVKTGNQYIMKEHDSMIFTMDGRWFWNSRSKSGRALDFIQHYEGRSYTEAILTLAGTLNDAPARAPVVLPSAPVERREFIPPERAAKHNAVFSYLQDTRRIDPELVRRLAHEGKIYSAITYTTLIICGYDKDGAALYIPRDPQADIFRGAAERFQPAAIASLDNKTSLPSPQTRACISAGDAARLVAGAGGAYGYRLQNLAMVGLDKDGNSRYMSLRSMNTLGKAFKADAPGSDKSFPFLISGDNETNTLCVFESPIEAMSYWSLCKAMGSPSLHADMISLGGAGVRLALDRYLREHPQTRHIVLGLNNDTPENGHKISAGQNGTEKIMETYAGRYDISVHAPHLNDWNDVLKNFHTMQLGSLLKNVQERPAPSPQRQQSRGVER